MTDTTALTELEQRLAAPGGAALRAALAQRLAELEQSANQRLASGLVPVAFQQYQAVAQAAAAAAIEDSDYFERTRTEIMATRDRFSARLRGMGFDVPDSRANFVFPEHRSVPAGELVAALRERGRLVRYFNKPRLSNRLRITIGTAEEMDAVADVLEELVKDR